jgi:HEAT repeat protein
VSASADLLADLGSAERPVLRRACELLRERFEQEPELRPALLERLRGDDPLARFGAAHVLFHSERPGLRLLPALLASLELPDGDLRWQAAQMLAVLGRLQGEVLPVLVHEARTSEVALRRRMALYALRELGPERAEVESALLDALDDPDPEVRRAGLACLAKLAAPSHRALSRALAVARKDPDPRMRRIAVVLLPGLVRPFPGERAEVEAVVDELARDPDPSLLRAARAAAAQLRGHG